MSEAEPRCASCGANLHERQRWCLACGAAARAQVATTPPWMIRGLAAAVVALLALAGLGYAMAALASS